jgi:hypothetical protein
MYFLNWSGKDITPEEKEEKPSKNHLTMGLYLNEKQVAVGTKSGDVQIWAKNQRNVWTILKAYQYAIFQSISFPACGCNPVYVKWVIQKIMHPILYIEKYMVVV